MFKKFQRPFAIIILILFVFSMTACDQAEGDPSGSGEETEGPAYKIGIMTGTVSQGEEEFMMAKQMQDKYGDMIVHTTYPDQFATEQETTITNMTSMASDPDVQAIVMVQGVIGAAAAIDSVRELRPDMLIILGAPAEHPELISEKADILLTTDAFLRGVSIMEQADKMGAETFVHYSFARHLSYESISSRLTIMKEEAEKLGMEFVEADAPDPTGDAGVTGSQQFIMEDVPRKVSEYGKDTAIFATNCSMMEPLIKQTIEQGSIFPVQCCPSPYHALPGALGLSIPEENKGDVDWIIQEINNAVIEEGAAGRIATWPVPVNMAYIEAGVEYSRKFIEGETDGRFDKDLLLSILEDIAGVDITLNPWPLGDDQYIENYLMYHSDYITFGTDDISN
ncbi:MAG: DUF3798 domain-containing protein [Clostridia bacterium]